MGNFNKAKGDPLTAEEWNSLGGEIERLDRNIDEISIQFPTSEEDKKKYLRGDKTWGNPQVPTISVNPEVDIVPASDANVEIEDKTENSVKLKFHLPQGEEGKAYVPNIDDVGTLTWELQDNPPELETPINIRGPQGEQGTGLIASSSKNGKTTTVVISTDEETPEQLDSFQINDGNDGHNPCLGRFAVVQSSFAETPRDGDYYYVDTVTDSTTTPLTVETKIYKYNGTAWDIGTVVDVSNLTFHSGEEVIDVDIDKTQLVNPADNALAKAVDIKSNIEPLVNLINPFEKVTLPTYITNWYISGTSKKWINTSSKYSCWLLAVSAGDIYRITAMGSNRCRFCFLKNNTKTDDTLAPLSDFDAVLHNVITEETVIVPSDSTYLYISRTVNDDELIPSSVEVRTPIASNKELKDYVPELEEVHNIKRKITISENIDYDYYKKSDWYPNSSKKWKNVNGTECSIIPVESNTSYEIQANTTNGSKFVLLTNIPSTFTGDSDVSTCSGDYAERQEIDAGETVTITPPNDCLYICVIGKVAASGVSFKPQGIVAHNNDSVIPRVIDNLESNSDKDALSAKQGNNINKKIESLANIVNPYKEIKKPKLNPWYINKSNNWWSKAIVAERGSYFIPIKPGTPIIVQANSVNETRFAFLTEMPDFNSLVSHDSPDTYSAEYPALQIISSGVEVTYTVPDDCNVLMVEYVTDKTHLPSTLYPSKLMYRATSSDSEEDEAGSYSQFSDQMRDMRIIATSIASLNLRRCQSKTVTFQTQDNRPQDISQSVDYVQIFNLLQKIKLLCNLSWTPLYDVPSRKRIDVDGNPCTWYRKDISFNTGIPYSSNMADNKTVGIDTSVHTFMTAVHNPYSLLYTEHLGGGNTNSYIGKSAWGRYYFNKGGNNLYAYYGTVCCGFTSAVVGAPYKYHNTVHDVYSKYFGEFIQLAPEGEINFDVIEVGDIFDDDKHSFIICQINKDNNEDIVGFGIAESTTGIGYGGCQIVSLTKNELIKKVKEGHSQYGTYYTHYRYAKLPLNKPLSDTDKKYLAEIEGGDAVQYNDEISTIYGDKPCLSKGELVVLNYNIGGDAGKDYIMIERYEEPQFILLISAPEDWDTAWNNYYYINEEGDYVQLPKDGDDYVAPEWEANKFYKKGNAIGYVLKSYYSLSDAQSSLDTYYSEKGISNPYTQSYHSEANSSNSAYHQHPSVNNHALVITTNDLLKPGKYRAYLTNDYTEPAPNGDSETVFTHWEILSDDIEISYVRKGVYDVKNNTGRNIEFVIYGKQISGDYRAFYTPSANNYAGRPITAYENSEKEFRLYIDEYIERFASDDLTSDEVKVKFVIEGDYGLATTNPITLPSVSSED